MRIITTIVLFLLLGCSGNDPSISRQEAINNVRQDFGVTGAITDGEIRDFIYDMCDVLEEHSPNEIVNRMDDSPRALIVSIMDNATAAFCPDQRESVEAYLD